MNRRFVLAVTLLALIGFAIELPAQVTGQLRGSVVDQTESAIPEASVSLLLPNGERAVFAVVTSGEGLFNIASVRPDFYDLVVEARGFQRQILRNIKVDAGRDTVVPAIKLQVQAVAQAVDVLATALEVDTSTAVISSSITNGQIQKLPMIDRYPLALIETQAGVSNGRGPTVINGQRTSYSNVTLDGINIQDNFLRENGLGFTPNLLTVDQIAEISITTSNASATVSGGASHVSFVTPSGTNLYHGSLYWYNRNSAVAANDWFNNRDGIANPNLNQNQIGGSIGGPIIRDKLLFYANYEAFRLRQQSSTDRTILTADARQGIYTYRNTAGAVQKVNILQAMNLSMDPAIPPILALVPTGDKINNFRSGDSTESLLRNTAGYSFVQRNNRTRDNVTGKIDFHPSTTHSLAGTYAWNRDIVDRPDLNALGYTVIPKVFNDGKVNLMSLGWRWNPSATFTNELRGGFNLAPAAFATTENFGSAIISPPLIGNPVNTFRAQGRDTKTYNYMDNASYTRGNHTLQFGFQAQKIRTAPYADAGITPTYTLGIGTGNTGLTAVQLPGISATDLAAANNLLALLAGYVTSYSQTFNITDRTSGFVNGATNLRHYIFDQYALYLQDKWRATTRLTITGGLRYDYFGVIDERDALFLLPQVVNNDSIATLLSNATLDFAGAAVERPWYKKDLNNFAPNIGLAYDVFGNGKTALRGGYSISYVNDQHIAAIQNNVATNAGLSSSATRTGLTGRITTGLPPVPVPAYKVPRTVSENYAVSSASAFGMPDPNLSTPYVQEWNLGIEHDLRGTIIEARYVGNHATKAFRGFDYNQVVIRENGFLADFNRALSNGNLARTATGVFDPAYNAALAGSQPLTVFPLLGSGGLLTNATIRTLIEQGQAGELATTYQTNGLNGSINFFPNPIALGTNLFANAADSNYHALQVDVRRNVKALQVQGNYTFSKVLSNASGTNQVNFEALLDNANPALEKGRTPYDITHAFKTNMVYDLPAGEGHRFNIRGLGRLLSGWTTSGVLIWQSGVPFSINSTRGTLNRGTRSASNTANTPLNRDQLEDIIQFRMTPAGPYIVAASAIGSDGRGVAPDGSSPFTGQVFFHPGPGTNGTLERRRFNGPAVFNLDFALMKRTQITEGQSLEFRMEASNIFNNVTWNVGDQSISSTNFGKITGTFYDRRLIQFSLHYRF